jgi:hypothetical protein
MLIMKKLPLRSLATVSGLLAALLMSSCQQFGPLESFSLPDLDVSSGKTKVCTEPTVRALADDVDALERHIERFGSVVAKQPDVWGQARLTKHREEFEKEMAAQLSTFDYTLQGSVSVTDQAYFADAFALSAAASGGTSGGGGAAASGAGAAIAGGAPKMPAVTNNVSTTAAPAAPSSSKSSSPSSGSPSSGQSSKALTPPDLPDQSDTFAAFTNMSRTPVRQGPALEFAAAKTGIIVEPTVLLDERARFVNHLQELRRINEGDDTADSPGYALNLVRIPISVLPGKRTEIGHGAEVTLTMTPYLSDDLLPTTFRNLVLNDLVDQIGYPVTQFINNSENSPYFDQRGTADFERLFSFVEKNPVLQNVPADEREELTKLRWRPSLQALLARPEWAWVDECLQTWADDPPGDGGAASPTDSATQQRTTTPSQHPVIVSSGPEDRKVADKIVAYRRVQHMRDEHVRSLHVSSPIPATKSRRARMPFPPTQLIDVYGYDFLLRITEDVYQGLAKERFIRPCADSGPIYIHLPDVQSYLQEELTAAYKFLASPQHSDLWQFCTPQLVEAVRTRKSDQLWLMRQQFKSRVPPQSGSANPPTSTTVALAWATIVESALLTSQLVQDMKEAAVTKGCPRAEADSLPYFLPDPPAEARKAFNDYVRCRWPIHVFALDPASDLQNIAATFSGRREMQLALSLAFVSGQISTRNMMRYARRIEFDFATVDLNGTAIGFSHGDDTFGWRFYPRFQTPDIESNATVLFRDLLWGGPSRNALLRQRRLEPGIRECVAVVIMPSFVPYATMNISSSWFQLTNPKQKLMDSSDAMKLSQRVKSIETCAPNVNDVDCYRDGDFKRLLQKVKQLETRLPLQSTQVQIPYENTLGGFAMFNTGITDLAPELTGWYGSPSINPKDSTTLFLVGNHFSVFMTRVIAGGQFVSNTELLSRQVMKVVIPANTTLTGDACQKFVDVHVATPYGVTSHLLIPVCESSDSAGGDAKGVAWKPASMAVAYVFGGTGITPPTEPAVPKTYPPSLVIQPGDVDPASSPVVDVAIKFAKPFDQVPFPTIYNIPYDSGQKGYVITGDVLTAPLFAAFGAMFGPQASNPPTPLTSMATMVNFKAGVTPVPPPAGSPPGLGKKTTNNLTITWIKAPDCVLLRPVAYYETAGGPSH